MVRSWSWAGRHVPCPQSDQCNPGIPTHKHCVGAWVCHAKFLRRMHAVHLRGGFLLRQLFLHLQVAASSIKILIRQPQGVTVAPRLEVPSAQSCHLWSLLISHHAKCSEVHSMVVTWNQEAPWKLHRITFALLPSGRVQIAYRVGLVNERHWQCIEPCIASTNLWRRLWLYNDMEGDDHDGHNAGTTITMTTIAQ